MDFWWNGCFMIPVKHPNADTLLPIIKQFIKLGSTIASNLWKAYRKLDELSEGYVQLTVNHSINFVNLNFVD